LTLVSQGLISKLIKYKVEVFRQSAKGGSMRGVLAGKAILIVDDEPDILDSLKELLDTSLVDCALDFETAKQFLKSKSYDAAILDITGVDGYDLLELAEENGTPALMLTAHALSSKHLIKTLKSGAYSYIPKQEMINISEFLSEIIEAKEKGHQKPRKWFSKLSPYFDEIFDSGWKDTHKDDLTDL
jgi:DNA-binding NtrC family response regulator